MCGTAWAPSTSTVMPRSLASAIIWATGTMVPSAFETWLIATSFVRSPSNASYSSSST